MFCKSTKNKSERPSLYISANFAYANSQSQLEKIAIRSIFQTKNVEKLIEPILASPFSNLLRREIW